MLTAWTLFAKCLNITKINLLIRNNKTQEIFPNVTRGLSILTTGATSTSVERATSALRHIKAGFCCMMGEECLNVLLTVCIHRDIFLDYDKTIVTYASKGDAFN